MNENLVYKTGENFTNANETFKNSHIMAELEKLDELWINCIYDQTKMFYRKIWSKSWNLLVLRSVFYNFPELYWIIWIRMTIWHNWRPITMHVFSINEFAIFMNFEMRFYEFYIFPYFAMGNFNLLGRIIFSFCTSFILMVVLKFWKTYVTFERREI